MTTDATTPGLRTPTDKEILGWADAGALRFGEKDGDLLWDAWLAEHDTRVRVAAIREAAGILVDSVSASWLRNYANRIEKAE